MLKKHFPVKDVEGFEDFVPTESADNITDSSPLYGLDCEMCFTEKGNQLTRISLVDSSGQCVLDTLVQPPNRILDYLTRFSGITAAMLQPITTIISDVQRKLVSLLPPDAVLVGHSLENDLRALKEWKDPEVQASQQLVVQQVLEDEDSPEQVFPSVAGSGPLDLAYLPIDQQRELEAIIQAELMQEKLGSPSWWNTTSPSESPHQKLIQTEDQRGHNPIEDALAALELAQYFIEAGPQQVVERHLTELWGESLAEQPAPPTLSTRFPDVLQRSGQSVTFLGKRSHDIIIHPSNQQWYSSDKETLASFRRQAARLFFSVVQFSLFSDHMKNSCLQQEHLHQRLRAHLRHMCVVFAGPFAAEFGPADVRRLFRCCGAVKHIKMLPSTHQIHAEIEFRLLEGAVLAVKTLNGHRVYDKHIQVQRPVYESTLDLDLTLHALMEDPLNVSHVHVTRLKPNVNIISNPNGPTLVPGAPRFHRTNDVNPDESGTMARDAYNSKVAASFNGTRELMSTHHHMLQAPSASTPNEEELTEVFGHFGVVKRILFPVKTNGRRTRHARINFQSPEGVEAVFGSSEELRTQRYLVCPSLTPGHLRSWAPGTNMEREEVASEEKCSGSSLMENDPVVRRAC
ncbi:hypothetical protein NHX12_018768 [Muraenolepis orangiensis]|uniref:RRM domain-containing protein n=1 Tax=Muraenolepis orangiensis TaxID=630683 RepID=A0A9Q0EZM5_9TELE|nr:hypothetical protein NHX12_018768 [Muraenolepis orangiensis]